MGILSYPFIFVTPSFIIHFDFSASLSGYHTMPYILVYEKKSWIHSSLAVNVFPAIDEVMLEEVRLRNSITQLGDINGAAAVKCAVSVRPGPNSRDNLSVHTTGNDFYSLP